MSVMTLADGRLLGYAEMGDPAGEIVAGISPAP
jgi:hypothetical protein